MPGAARLVSLLPLFAASLVASAAFAASTPPGVNIRWDRCFDDGGTMNKTFACNVNTGSDQAVLSFVLDSSMPNVVGVAVNVGVKAAVATLPEWWKFRNAGTCRQNELLFITSPPLPPGNCEDWGNGLESGGLAAYKIGVNGANTAVI